MRRNSIYKIYAAIVIALGSVLFFSEDLSAQDPSKRTFGSSNSLSSTFTQKADSTTSDSLNTAKSQQDSITFYTPLNRHGSVSIFDSSAYRKISKYDFRFKDYDGLYDIIKDEVPASRLPLGNYGQFDHFSFFGGSPRDVAFTFNNRPINDLEYGSYNPARFSAEFLESIEIYTGSDAVIFSDNASGALINIQEIKYNSATPYTRMWFTDGGGNAEHLGVDGIFSQNFAPNWNFTFGFKTQSAENQYQNNSFYDSWNVRGILRWNPSNRTSISLVENFVKHYIGTNGGIDSSKSFGYDGKHSIYDPLVAAPIFSELNQKVFRHNMTLSISSILGKDSSAAVNGSIFLSASKWSHNRGDQTTGGDDTNSVIRHYSNYFGANGQYEQKIFDIFALKIGGNIMINDLEETVYHSDYDSWAGAAFGHLKFSPIENIVVSGGMRLRQSERFTSVSSGAKAVLKFSDHLSLTGDLSISERTPAPTELTLNDRSAPKKELNTLALSEIVWRNGTQTARLGAFARYTVDPILSAGIYDSQDRLINTYSFNGDTRDAIGLNFSYADRFIDRIGLKVWGQVNFSQTDGVEDGRLPIFYGGAESYYEFRRGSSILRVGARTGISGALRAEQYVPVTGSYIVSEHSRGALLHGLDLFISAKLGNAFLRLTYENILDSFILQNYWQTSLYPMHGANFRMTVSWAFFD